MDRSSTSQYLSKVGEEHRKSFGQFFTDPRIASFMADWVAGSGQPGLHDPCFGLGAFHAALKKPCRGALTGSEIDPGVLSFGKRSADLLAVDVTRQDYLLSWGGRYGNILCNPPYMRFQHFRNRKQVAAKFEQHLGLKLSGYTNTASAFLLKSLSELVPGGRLAYVMPLEFLNTGYGKAVKERLIDGGHLAAILKLSCEREAFPDATTSVGIILYDSSAFHSDVQFFNVRNLDELDDVLEGESSAIVEHTDLMPGAKWLPFFQGKAPLTKSSLMVPLEFYGRFTRGIATGANAFFSLRPSRAREVGLSLSELAPCVTKSAQIRSPFLTEAAFGELVDRDEPIYLFSPKGALSPQAARYVHDGEIRRLHERFLTSKRNPWYKTESRFPAPLLVGVFSRGGYKVVQNRAKVLTLTCFHGFHPNLFGNRYTDKLFLYLLSDAGREIVSFSVREYGDSLHKFEPNDLNAALAPSPEWLDKMDDHEVARSLDHVGTDGVLPDWANAMFAELMPDSRATPY